MSAQYHLGCSTVDELSYAPDEAEKRRNEEQRAATGRMYWKTLQDKEGEAVWSPALEAVLIEGVRKYGPPTPSVITKKSRVRYPMRNRLISDYIYETTGKYRAPKQVGSRLQQMRHTCRLPDIRILIASSSDDKSGADVCSSLVPSISPPSMRLHSIYENMNSSRGPTTQEYPSRGPTTQEYPNKTPEQQLPCVARANVFVTVKLESDASKVMLRAPVALAGCRKDAQLYTVINLVPLRFERYPRYVQVNLSFFDSTVQFSSPLPVHTQTVFSVSTVTLQQPILSEWTTMVSIEPPPGCSGWFYATVLCPQLWKMLSWEPTRLSLDVEQYRVLQCITPQWFPGIDASPINICYRLSQIPAAAPGLFSEAHQSNA